MATMPAINANVTTTINWVGTKQRLINLLEDLLATTEDDEQAERLLEAIDQAALLYEYRPISVPPTWWPTWPQSPNTCQACAPSGKYNCLNPPGGHTVTC